MLQGPGSGQQEGGEATLPPRTWEAPVRRKMKEIAKMACFRTADTGLRVPYTPGSDLAKRVRVVVDSLAHRGTVPDLSHR